LRWSVTHLGGTSKVLHRARWIGRDAATVAICPPESRQRSRVLLLSRALQQFDRAPVIDGGTFTVLKRTRQPILRVRITALPRALEPSDRS
jgi:hypothetical protein